MIKNIEEEVHQEKIHQTELHDHSKKIEVFDPFKVSYRRRWWLAMIMAFGTQATGVNALLFFSNTIYQKYDPKNAAYYTRGMGGSFLVFNLIVSLFVNKVGRRSLMLFGMGIDIVTLFLFLIFNQLENFTGIFTSIIFFFLGFQISLGPIAWLYLPEIIDHDGVANYSIIRWLFTFAVGICTPYMIVNLTTGGCFGVYGALLCIVVIYFCIEFKETKDLT
jgi:Na+/melibiose symporter-like transporter